jgi:hypothetical protein
VLLDLEHLSRISYNVMQAGFAINAVDSQRVDKVGQDPNICCFVADAALAGLHVPPVQRQAFALCNRGCRAVCISLYIHELSINEFSPIGSSFGIHPTTSTKRKIPSRMHMVLLNGLSNAKCLRKTFG